MRQIDGDMEDLSLKTAQEFLLLLTSSSSSSLPMPHSSPFTPSSPLLAARRQAPGAGRRAPGARRRRAPFRGHSTEAIPGPFRGHSTEAKTQLKTINNIYCF